MPSDFEKMMKKWMLTPEAESVREFRRMGMEMGAKMGRRVAMIVDDAAFLILAHTCMTNNGERGRQPEANHA